MLTTITFAETSVSWHLEDIEIHGSLTNPRGRESFPAVIMVAGSGPTDRNWNSPLIPGTNGSAALLARTLTDLGYITLRYDKRVSGPQARENVARLAGKISMQDHLDELAGGVNLLAELNNVDPGRIFILTNNAGCIHALNYQTQANALPLAGLVLTAAPARPMGAAVRSQIATQFDHFPGCEKWLAVYDEAMNDFAAGRPVRVSQSLPEGLRATILGITNPNNQPFARELWEIDPGALLAKTNLPILILNGKKDIQLDWQVEDVGFQALAKNHPNITIAYSENANHVLKYEPRNHSKLSAEEVLSTYNAEGSQLDIQSLDIITTWLADHCCRAFPN